MLAAAHREGDVYTEQTEADGMRVRARLEPASAKRLREFIKFEIEVDPHAATTTE
jgi:hypothetical protein